MINLMGFWGTMVLVLLFELSGGWDFQPRERATNTQAPWAVRETDDRRMAKQAQVDLRPLFPQLGGSFEITPSQVVYRAVGTPTPPVVEIAATDEAAFVYVSGSRVNLRAGPNTDHPVLATLVQGQSAVPLAVEGGWTQVRVDDSGQIGWMSSQFLTDG